MYLSFKQRFQEEVTFELKLEAQVDVGQIKRARKSISGIECAKALWHRTACGTCNVGGRSGYCIEIEMEIR